MAIKPKAPVLGGADSSKRKLRNIVIAAVILLITVGGSVAATWYVLNQRAAENPVYVKQQAIYTALVPSFVVTINHQGRARYMQVSMTMMGRDPAQMEALKLHMPMLRNKLVMLLSEYSFEQLTQADGKALLIEQATNTVQTIAKQQVGAPVIERLLFNNIVLQ